MDTVRDQLSEHITADRLKLEARRAGPDFIILVVAGIAAIIGLGWVFAHVAPSLVKKNNTVAFKVDSARAVKPGLNEIRIKGVPAGRITDVKLVDGHPVITAEIEKKYGKVFRDARVELRPNSALEDQFIDVVSRGHASTGEISKSHPLAASQTTVPVSVDDVLSTFNANTRARLRVLLADLGKGLDDNGEQLGQVFAEAAPLVREAGRLSGQIARRADITERLVHNTGVLTSELARRDVQLRALVHNSAATLTTLQSRSGALDQTIAEIPPTINAVNTSFAATRGVLGDVNAAVRALSPVVSKADDTLTDVRALSADAKPAVNALQTPVSKLVPLARNLRPLSSSLSEAIATLRPQVDTLNHTTKDLADCKKGVQGFFQWDASMTKYGDSRGQAPRGTLAAGVQTLGLASPDEAAYAGCVAGAPIGGRPPSPATDGR